jgi:vanillate/3-O-methylgallate O-demethylase
VTWGEPDGGSGNPLVERHTPTTIRATIAKRPFPVD